MRRWRLRVTVRDMLWLGLVVALSGTASTLWIYAQESLPRAPAPTPRLVRLADKGPPLSLDGVHVGDTRAMVIRTLGPPGSTGDNKHVLYRVGEYDVYFDEHDRVTTLVGGLKLRQGTHLLLSVGDDETRVEEVLGRPDREARDQPPWGGQTRYYKRFELRVYTHTHTLSEYLDVFNMVDEVRAGVALHPTVRGLVLGGPYLGN